MNDLPNRIRRLEKLIEDDNRHGDNARAERVLESLSDAYIKFWIASVSDRPNDHRVVLFDAMVESAHTIRCPKKVARAIEVIGDSGLQPRARAGSSSLKSFWIAKLVVDLFN